MAMNPAPAITFTSPSGLQFEAKWIGGERTISKRIAEFDYPLVNGSSLQDLGMKSTKLPLDFWFDDPFHRITARNFCAAMNERGPWTIYHPTLGKLTAQPSEISPDDQPVKSANATAMKTQWTIARPETAQTPMPLTAGSIAGNASDITNSLGNGVSLTKSKDRESFRSMMKRLKTGIKKAMDMFTTTVNRVHDITDSVRNANNAFRTALAKAFDTLDTILSAPYIIVSTVISAIVTILSLPNMLKGMVREKVALYKLIGKSIRDSANSDISGNVITKSAAHAINIASTATMTALCTVAVSGTAISHDESIAIADSIYQEYADSVSCDDALKLAIQTNLAKTSYNGSEQFEPMRNLVGRTIGYVLSDTYSTKVRKIVTVHEETATFAFSIANYPDKQPEDAYDFLIDTNALSGEQIITIPAGTNLSVFL